MALTKLTPSRSAVCFRSNLTSERMNTLAKPVGVFGSWKRRTGALRPWTSPKPWLVQRAKSKSSGRVVGRPFAASQALTSDSRPVTSLRKARSLRSTAGRLAA